MFLFFHHCLLYFISDPIFFNLKKGNKWSWKWKTQLRGSLMRTAVWGWSRMSFQWVGPLHQCWNLGSTGAVGGNGLITQSYRATLVWEVFVEMDPQCSDVISLSSLVSTNTVRFSNKSTFPWPSLLSRISSFLVKQAIWSARWGRCLSLPCSCWFNSFIRKLSGKPVHAFFFQKHSDSVPQLEHPGYYLVAREPSGFAEE